MFAHRTECSNALTRGLRCTRVCVCVCARGNAVRVRSALARTLPALVSAHLSARDAHAREIVVRIALKAGCSMARIVN